MKKNEFSKALGEVDEKYVNEAINYSTAAQEMPADQPVVASAALAENQAAPSGKTRNYRKTMKIWRGIAIAACAVLVASIGLVAATSLFSAKGSRSDAYFDYKSEMAYEAPAADYGLNEDEYYAADSSPSESIKTSGAGNLSGDTTASIPESNAKIIHTAYLSLETKDFDVAVKSLEDIVKENGAYFETSNINTRANSYRYAYYTVRIPSEKLDEFLNQAEGICTVVSVNRSAEDVSENYYDIETRLDTARTKLTRLNELLAQATTMEDIITLESAISDTQYLIDSLTGSLKHYDSLVDYSTVNIDLSEVYKTGTDTAPLTFGQRISKAFNNSLSGFGEFLEDLVVFLANSWIWLIIVIGVIIAIIFIIKGIVKKHRK